MLVLSGNDNVVTVPALSGSTGGTTTGLYYPTSNQVALATNGSEAIRIDNNQNVLVGSGSSNPFNSKFYLTGTPTANAPIASFYSQGNSSTAGIGLYNDSASVGIWSSSGNLIFRTNGNLASGSETMRIDSSGFVGIGTNSPSSYGKLSVTGTTSLGVDQTSFISVLGGGGTARLEGNGSDTNINVSLSTKGTGAHYFWRGGYGGSITALFDGSGKVGIGTTNTTASVHLFNSSSAGFRMTGGIADSDIWQRQVVQFVNVFTWATVLSITPSTAGNTWMRGYVKASISGHNSGNYNAALIDAIWYLDLNGGSGATSAQVSAGTATGGGTPGFRVNMSGNVWQIQVQAPVTAQRYDGCVALEIVLSHGAGTTATFTIA